MATEQFTNGVSTTLNGTITSGQTTLVVASATGFSTVPNFRILVENEIMLVTGVSSTTFTVTRGAENSSAQAHNSGVTITQILTAGALNQLKTDIITSTIFSGTFASRPAAGTANRLYFATDLNVTFYDNGSTWTATAPGQIFKQMGNPAFNVVSSNTKTALFSITIPANSLGTQGEIRITMRGIGFNNNGAGQTHKFDLDFGGSNLLSFTQSNGGSATNKIPMPFDIVMGNSGATNTQFAWMRWNEYVNSGANVFAGDVVDVGGYQDAGAVDTTADRTLSVSVTLGANSSNLSYKHYFTLVEIIL